MSTSTTHQQSLADVSSETRPLMLEIGNYIPWASHLRRETRFNNEFDQFIAEPGEELVSVYNRFAQLMNDLEQNGIKFPKVTVNTKVLNCLQPEWMKYVTQVPHTDSSFKIPSPYYVTHPSSVVDYDDDYQGGAFQNNSEDPLISAMMLLARAITQSFSNPTNNRLRTSSNPKNQAIVQADKVNIQSRNSGNDGRNTRCSFIPEEIIEGSATNVQCYNCSEKGLYARNCPKLKVRDSKYFMEYMLLTKQDEAGLTDEQNDFLVADATRMKEIEDEVQKPSTSYVNPLFAKDNQEQKYPNQPKINNDIIGEEQIDSNIKFDELNIDVNSGSVEYDNNVQASYKLDQFARNAYKKAEKQQINANKKKQNVRTVDYNKLNALYEDFVLQKELSAEQKYFSSTFIPFENSSNANTSTSPSKTKPLVASMPSSNPIKLYLEKMENEFKKLFALLQTNSKRESIFYTTLEEIRLTKFCQQEVKPILHELHLNCEIFQKRFSADIKEMKDVFDSTKSALSATWKQNKLLNDQLLEAKIKHGIECCVFLSHKCVNNNVHDEIKRIQRDSIEIQEGMQK
ncbi:integrase, catalytic region, zinc finger, CCHC-type containing protein [Tanacetum coccineum]